MYIKQETNGISKTKGCISGGVIFQNFGVFTAKIKATAITTKTAKPKIRP